MLRLLSDWCHIVVQAYIMWMFFGNAETFVGSTKP